MIELAQTQQMQFPNNQFGELINKYMNNLDEILKIKPPKGSNVSEEEKKGLLYGSLIGAGLAAARGRNILDALSKGAGAFSTGYVSGLDRLYEDKKRQLEEERLMHQLELQNKTFGINVLGKQIDISRLLSEQQSEIAKQQAEINRQNLMRQADEFAIGELIKKGIQIPPSAPLGNAYELYKNLIQNEYAGNMDIRKAIDKETALLPLKLKEEEEKARIRAKYDKSNLQPKSNIRDQFLGQAANSALKNYMAIENTISKYTPRVKNGVIERYYDPSNIENTMTVEQYNALFDKLKAYKDWYKSLTGIDLPSVSKQQADVKAPKALYEKFNPKNYKGRVVEDSVTGERYISNGVDWINKKYYR